MVKKLPYEIFPLGDTALTIDLGNTICSELNRKAVDMQAWLVNHPFDGLKDIILGYSSLSILYDPILIQRKYKPKSTSFEFVKTKLEEAFDHALDSVMVNSEEVMLPVCYEEIFGPDLAFIAQSKNASIEEVVNIHLSRNYRVYMMGFLPGFAYMGEVDDRIKVPRKQKPESVSAGSVGIANGQTGIYPLDSPGGWQIIGRTPLKLFDPSSPEPVKLKAGQSVRFNRISLSEFEQLASQTI